jgi:flagellar biosynthesis protein FlhG
MILHQAQGLRPRGSARRAASRARSGIVAIVSGKGGVGKSALAVNLASAAAQGGVATLLIDGDVGLANADLLMGWVPRHDFGDCVEAGLPLEEVVCTGPSGLELLVVGSRRSAVARLARSLAGEPDEPLAARIATKSLTVLDLGAGIGTDVLELARHADPVWLVATPEPTSLADAYTTAKQLWDRAPALRLELIVNRAADRAAGERTHCALERLVRRFLGRSLPLRAVLPEDPAMGRAVARQRPVALDAPDSPIGRRIGWLAESLVDEIAGGQGVGPPSDRAAGPR